MKVCALAVMIAMATPAVAQDAPPASAAGAANPAPASTVDSASLPRCSAKVTDRCIQGGGRNSRHASKKKSKPHKAAQAPREPSGLTESIARSAARRKRDISSAGR